MTVRAFFGLPLPEEHREALGNFLLHLMQPKFRWTPAENLHITVRFLGQVEPAVAERLAGRVQAASPRSFAVQLGALDAFKRGKLARVLWLAVQLGAPEISALEALVETECAREGLEREKRPYHPHLTLARSRQPEGAPVPRVTPPELPAWRADELVLYRSHLGRSGAVYEPLRTIPLR